jgi:hypothetical protein
MVSKERLFLRTDGPSNGELMAYQRENLQFVRKLEALVEKRKWLGNETVMDAGAGSGSVTRVLAEKVPGRRVYVVDADPFGSGYHWPSWYLPIIRVRYLWARTLF